MADYAEPSRRTTAAPARGRNAEAGQALQPRPAVQRLLDTAQMLNARPAVVAQRALAERLADAAGARPAPSPVNRTGLPDRLKEGIEALSGLSMDDVRVHANSAEPAQLQAHAFARGTDIHLAPGQEQRLPHEAWHVVQQKQGRVKATTQMKEGVAVNDDAGLEAEADRMGTQALPSRTMPEATVGQRAVKSLAAVVQRAKIEVAVTGITHLVQAKDGSILEGDEYAEVVEGQVLDIDTGQKLRSRRGPNQELYAEFDRDGKPDFRWFLVLAVDGKKVHDGVYVRDETFRTDRPEALGTRPARIGGRGRDRTAPEQQDLHQLTSEILAQSRALQGAGVVQSAVAPYLIGKEKSGNREPRQSLRVIQIAYAFSQNQDVWTLLKSNPQRVFDLTEFLQAVAGRQILQAFTGEPAMDVEQRAIAWHALVAGIDMLSGTAKLDAYLDRVLDHNKGYAQLAESAQSYADEVQIVAQGGSLEEIWTTILGESSNTSIWLGGQISEMTMLSQLQHPKFSTNPQMTAETCEKQAWSMLLSRIYIVGAKVTDVQELIEQIKLAPALLYDRVRAIVPKHIDLHPEFLAQELENL